MLLKGSGAAVAVWATALITGSVAAPSAAAKRACEKIELAVPDSVSYRLSLSYTSEVTSYWSQVPRDLKPACLVLPKSAEDVAAAVRVLNDYPDVEFAVKSGGHDPNARHASVQDGVLISMKDLTGTTYDDEKGLAYVKPGGEWNDVIGALDPQGVAVVGGRLGESPRYQVGVNGFRG